MLTTRRSLRAGSHSASRAAFLARSDESAYAVADMRARTIAAVMAVGCGSKAPSNASAGSDRKVEATIPSAGSASAGSDLKVEPVLVTNGYTGPFEIPVLSFSIDHIYRGQSPVTHPPFHEDVGDWLYVDAHVTGDVSASFGLGISGGNNEGRHAVLLPTDATQGARVVAAFAKRFHVDEPPTRKAGVLRPLSVPAVVLGTDLAKTDNGLGGYGTWTATKWFFDNDDEIFINFSLTEAQGEFSEKDSEYDAAVARALADALRDGAAQ